MKKKFLILGFLFATTLFALPSNNDASSIFMKNSQAALAQAKKSKKPLLIDFYGIWCPPCNEMNETVFESRSFLEKSKSFVLLSVDADAKESWQLKNEYHVGGYPTYIFATAEGKEIYRVVGSRAEKEFLKVMDLVLAGKSKDFTQACASNDADDLWKCAVTSSERDDKPAAEKAYQKLSKVLKPGSARYELARSYAVDHEVNVDLKRAGYERLMNEFPESPSALVWASEYFDTFNSETPVKPKREPIEKVLLNYSKMANDSRRDELGLDATDLAEMRADLLGKLERKDESKAAWRDAAILLEARAHELPPGISARGFTIERIYCLQSSGDVDGALRLANDYREKYPEEFTFHFWAARILDDAKRYPEAARAGQKMYEKAYGDNKLRAAALYINILSALADKAGAKAVRDEVAKLYPSETKTPNRTLRYLKDVEEAYKKSQM